MISIKLELYHCIVFIMHLKNKAFCSDMFAKGQTKVSGVNGQIGCPSLRC